MHAMRLNCSLVVCHNEAFHGPGNFVDELSLTGATSEPFSSVASHVTNLVGPL